MKLPMRSLYSLAFSLMLPAVFIKLWRKGKTQPAYRERWKERLGLIDYPKLNQRPIWIHTVSVGEFLAARPVIQHLLDNHNVPIVVTTMTPTGSEQVVKAFGDQVYHCYLPYDLPYLLSPFFNTLKPKAVIIMETELWPNLINGCHKRGIPSYVINARLSEKSAKGYRKFAQLSREMLQKITHIAVQNGQDAQRFIDLGLAESAMSITGSIKFDLDIAPELQEKAKQLKEQLSQQNSRQIFIAASTHPGEDEIILEAFSIIRKTIKDCLLVLAPRHPNRAQDIQALCQQSGFNNIFRSENITPDSSTDVLIGDTLGELLLFFGAADLAFVGGSFVDNGGHNYIEPAAWGLPVLSGPSTFNFAEITNLLLAAGGMAITANAEKLAEETIQLLTDKQLRNKMGAAAKAVAEENRGALKRLLTYLDSQLCN